MQQTQISIRKPSEISSEKTSETISERSSCNRRLDFEATRPISYPTYDLRLPNPCPINIKTSKTKQYMQNKKPIQ